MERRALIILAATLMLVIGVFWWASPRERPRIKKESIVFPPGVDVQGKGLVFLRSGADGEIQIAAERGFGVRDAEEAVLEGVSIKIDARDGRHGRLVAQKCTLPAASRVVTLEGNVVAETDDGFRLKTTDVVFDWAERKAETDSKVSLEGPGLSLTGTGAVVEWVEQTITIRENVVATIHPRQLPTEIRRGLPGLERLR